MSKDPEGPCGWCLSQDGGARPYGSGSSAVLLCGRCCVEFEEATNPAKARMLRTLRTCHVRDIAQPEPRVRAFSANERKASARSAIERSDGLTWKAKPDTKVRAAHAAIGGPDE